MTTARFPIAQHEHEWKTDRRNDFDWCIHCGLERPMTTATEPTFESIEQAMLRKLAEALESFTGKYPETALEYLKVAAQAYETLTRAHGWRSDTGSGYMLTRDVLKMQDE